MQRVVLMLVVLVTLVAFWRMTRPEPPMTDLQAEQLTWDQFWLTYLEPQLPVAGGFALPLFPPDGSGAYVKRSFRERQNLGEDWDLEPGRPEKNPAVNAVADGLVILADDFGAVWGKVVIILHRMPNGAPWPAVESMYANLQTLQVHKGDIVTKGAPLGTLGSTPVSATPELHFEIRTELGHMLGPGEADLAEGWVNPTKFIEEHKN
ncbi:MAG: M23 family metallopeptidase [Verrucomicrobiales bacterium]|jgi:murein DD-endopeptidase MepM/ murein hydrolase activator NlpD|nr:M23 family metallopeptidase [Verrucomicrobiales bacterium]